MNVRLPDPPVAEPSAGADRPQVGSPAPLPDPAPGHDRAADPSPDDWAPPVAPMAMPLQRLERARPDHVRGGRAFEGAAGRAPDLVPGLLRIRRADAV